MSDIKQALDLQGLPVTRWQVEYRMRLSVNCDHSGIVVAVDDANPALPRTRKTDRRRHSGRGLVLVQRLAADWGVRRTATGKQVWFRLA